MVGLVSEGCQGVGVGSGRGKSGGFSVGRGWGWVGGGKGEQAGRGWDGDRQGWVGWVQALVPNLNVPMRGCHLDAATCLLTDTLSNGHPQ